MAVVSDKTIAQAASAFPSEHRATAVAVALAESGGNATATNKNDNGSTDHGLWQINSVHESILRSGDWRKPADNGRMATQVYLAQGWRAWYAYRDGKHVAFLTRAQNAVKAAAADPDSGDGIFDDLIPDVEIPGLDSVQEAAGWVTRAFSVLTDRDLWIRIGILTVGAVLLVVGIAALVWALGGKSTVQTVVGVAAPAGKAKALKSMGAPK